MFSWVLDLCGLKAQAEKPRRVPWLGKDVILLILHQAAGDDYETFCNVRLVARWVAKTMDISEPLQAQQVKWRHMVEDVALRRIENEVTHRDQIVVWLKVKGLNGRDFIKWSGFLDCRIHFIRNTNGLLHISLDNSLHSNSFYFQSCCITNVRLEGRIRFASDCFQVSVTKE
jgi:hypothetical protein